MALYIAIEDPQTGVTANYWRVVGVAVDAGSGGAAITLGGYVSEDVRARADGQFVAQRNMPISGAAFGALASRPALPISDGDRAAIEEHILSAPAAVAVYLRRALDLTTYAAIAEPAYEWARVHRRQCQVDPETGEGLIGSERWPAESVVTFSGIPTVPSEFADALDV